MFNFDLLGFWITFALLMATAAFILVVSYRVSVAAFGMVLS
jgi:hypothetical protein